MVTATLIAAIICAAAPDSGREEFERAARYYKAQEYEAALPWFQKAYEASGHRPSTIRGLAQCERSLRMYGEAIEHFREYLATNPSAAEAKSVRKTIDLLEDLKAEKDALAIPAPILSDPQPAPKPEPELEFEREPAPEREPPPMITTPPPPQQQLTPPITTHTTVEGASTTLPWITIGTGIAVTVAGATLFTIGRGDLRSVENAPAGTPYRGEIEEAASRAPALTGLGIGMAIAGLTGTGIGIAWLIGQDDEEEDFVTATSIQAGGQ